MIQILHNFTNRWIFSNIGRNCLLGNRKKIAKFVMRTFTSHSTFLYGRGEVRSESWEGEIGGQGPYKEDGEKKMVELKRNNVTRFLTVKNCPLVSIIWVLLLLMNCLAVCTLCKKIWKHIYADQTVTRSETGKIQFKERSQLIDPAKRSIIEKIAELILKGQKIEMVVSPIHSQLWCQKVRTRYNCNY